MKSNSTWTLAVLASFVCAIGLAGCGSGGSTGGSPPPPPPPTITVTGPTTLQIGAPTYQYTCSGASSCTWTSNNTSVLAIDSTTGIATTTDTNITGSVTVTITATADGGSGTLDVTVSNGIIYATNQPATFTLDIPSNTSTKVEDECNNPAYFADHQLALCTPNIADEYNQLYIFAPSGKLNGATFNQATLTFATLQVVDLAAPSPDGTMVAFVAYDPTVKLLGYYTAPFTNASASPTPKLIYQSPSTAIGLGRPGWSRDGKSLVINEVSNGRSDLWVIPADGSSAGTAVTSAASDPHGAGDGSFSKDGTTIYYTSCLTGNDCSILNTPSDNNGSNPGTLVIAGWNPEISPNGLSLLFNDSGGIEMLNFDAPGDAITLVGGGSLASW